MSKCVMVTICAGMLAITEVVARLDRLMHRHEPSGCDQASAVLPPPKPHPDDWFIGPWGIKTRDGRVVADPETLYRSSGGDR